jgi:hypothetical protein
MATPFGQALKPMFDQMQQQMATMHGAHEINADTSEISTPSASLSASSASTTNSSPQQGSASTGYWI